MQIDEVRKLKSFRQNGIVKNRWEIVLGASLKVELNGRVHDVSGYRIGSIDGKGKPAANPNEFICKNDIGEISIPMRQSRLVAHSLKRPIYKERPARHKKLRTVR